MRIGIYNRWLPTLGGGEKYSLTVAECLSREHSVSVISHKYVPKGLATQKLNCDLSRVDFVTVPDCPAMQIAPLTSEYDVFLNASFLDLFPSYAAHSALLVYFPTPIYMERNLRLRRRVGLVLKHLLRVPTFADGVYSTRAVGGSQLREAGECIQIKLAPSARPYEVSFQLAARDPSHRQAEVFLDGRQLDAIDLPANSGFTSCRLVVPPQAGSQTRDLTVQACADGQPGTENPVKLLMTNFEIADGRYRVYQLAFERTFKALGLQMHRIPPPLPPWVASVDSYSAIWAISEFTRKWIKRYWNRPSKILYPPVEVEQFAPLPKRNQILSVGRFFAASHNKKHHEMVAVFKSMVDQGLQGWDLHLAGGTGPRDVDAEYLQRLYRDAEGYPITVHPDIPFADLVHLYGESALYWHASGLGEHEEREPIKFEHFGITTVEAMASGCVPVVIGKGGQPEIVQHGRNGYLWKSTGEMKALTWSLVRDAARREKMSRAAMADCRRYDRAHFATTLQELAAQVGIVKS